MMTLLDRARAALASPAAKAVLAAVPLATAATAQAGIPDTIFTLDFSSAGVQYGGSYDASNFSVTSAALGPKGLKVSGSLGTLSGDPMLQNAYIPGTNLIDLSGTIGVAGGPTVINPGDFLRFDVTVDFTFSGGSVTIDSAFGGFQVFGSGSSDFLGASLGTPPVVVSGAPVTFSLVTTAATIPAALGGWSFSLGFNWQGYSATDTLFLDIPSDSIDVRLIPTPGAAALLGLGGLAVARRRRR